MRGAPTIVTICGGLLILLAILPFDMRDEGKLMLAVLGIVFMIFGILMDFIANMWRH
jgi:hypothetical protein